MPADFFGTFIIRREKRQVEYAEIQKRDSVKSKRRHRARLVCGNVQNRTAKDGKGNRRDNRQKFENADGEYPCAHQIALSYGQVKAVFQVVIFTRRKTHKEYAESGVKKRHEIWIIRNKQHEGKRQKNVVRRVRRKAEFLVNKIFHNSSFSRCTIMSSSDASVVSMFKTSA